MPVAFPARLVRPLDEGVVPVSPGVEERDGVPGSRLIARVVTHRPWSTRRAALDGGHRHPSRTRSIERRGHLPQPGWSLWSNQRGQANRLRGRHRSGAVRESCPPRRAKHGPSNSYSKISPGLALTNASNSCSWTAGPRTQPPVDSRTSSAARFVASGATSHHATSTAPRSFARSVTPGGSKSPMATSCAADGWPAASRAPWRQPPDGCTLLQ